jgi:hypothetical protein
MSTEQINEALSYFQTLDKGEEEPIFGVALTRSILKRKRDQVEPSTKQIKYLLENFERAKRPKKGPSEAVQRMNKEMIAQAIARGSNEVVSSIAAHYEEKKFLSDAQRAVLWQTIQK